MLRLDRTKGQAVVVDGRTKIRVLGVGKNGRVQLGIEAPLSVRVHREEVEAKHRAEEVRRPRLHPLKVLADSLEKIREADEELSSRACPQEDAIAARGHIVHSCTMIEAAVEEIRQLIETGKYHPIFVRA